MLSLWNPARKKSKYEQRYETLKQKNGTCKVCSKYHTYKDRFGKFWPSNRFVTCEKFKSMNVKQRAQALEKNKACARCTSWAHNRSNCTAKVVTCEEKINGANCGLDHSKLVCGSGVAYVMTLKTKSNNKTAQNSGDLFDEDAATISYQQDIPIKSEFGNVFARTFWDTGSNRVLINSNFAKELNLKPRSSTVTLNVAGGEKKRIETEMFSLKLIDRNGKSHDIWGYGVENIIETEDPVDPSSLRDLFPHIPARTFEKLQMRRIDILIGLNYAGLFPSGGEGQDCVDNLKVMKTKFGSTGYILGGSHKELKVPTLQFSSAAAQLRLSKSPVTVHNLEEQVESKLKEVQIAKVRVEKELMSEFWQTDQLGVEPPRRCNSCKQCAERGECSEEHVIHTIKEEIEKQLLEDNIKIVDGKVEVEYPLLKDPGCFSNNRSQVIKVAEKLWQRLKKTEFVRSFQ